MPDRYVVGHRQSCMDTHEHTSGMWIGWVITIDETNDPPFFATLRQRAWSEREAQRMFFFHNYKINFFQHSVPLPMLYQRENENESWKDIPKRTSFPPKSEIQFHPTGPPHLQTAADMAVDPVRHILFPQWMYSSLFVHLCIDAGLV